MSMSGHAAGIDGLDQPPIGDGDTGTNACAALTSLASLTAGCRTTVELAAAVRGSGDAVERHGVIGRWLAGFMRGFTEVAAGTDESDGSRVDVALELGG